MAGREQRALHRAASMAKLAQVRRLLERNPALAATTDAVLYTALHKVTMHASMPASREAIAAMLLAAAPQTAAAIDLTGRTALHHAAASGSLGLVRRLTAAAPAAVTIPDFDGRLPIHLAAARAGGAAVVGTLLAVAPWTAMTTTGTNTTPLFEAARADEESALLLLAEAPAAASLRTTGFFRSGWTALTAAAYDGRPRLVAAILEAAPGVALVADFNNDLPLHWASQFGFDATHTEVRRLLIDAAPETCLAQDNDLDTPLMCAAIQANAGAVAQLLAAAPAAAVMRNKHDLLPCDKALHRVTLTDAAALESARLLMGAGDAADAAAALANAAADCRAQVADAALRLWPEFVACRALAAEQWALLPAELPGLEAALPAVLARSEAEAACLVAHLPAPERQWVRAAMLSLARLQGRTHLSIPVPTLQHIVSLAIQPALTE